MLSFDLLHLLDPEWEKRAGARYGRAYPELCHLFRGRLLHGFHRSNWLPDPLALDYLIRILIRFLPVSLDRHYLETALDLRNWAWPDPVVRVRLYESAGEMILWYSGLYRQPVLTEEGRDSYREAFEQLREIEPVQRPLLVVPGAGSRTGSKRLRVDRMFSSNFDGFIQVLSLSGIIDNPRYLWFRYSFRRDDLSNN